ncbi:MAG: hypothetical protein OXU20_40410 [Myxococcales bacterium]|nr:hypothetical protein [Myxococcales bacterium]MDD9965950.1 hypothetical protein [Myxococcales bacterium]
MEEAREIETIRERVDDLVGALRDAEADELAQRLEGYALGFTHVTEVRRSVSSIAMQLAYWRETGDELPDAAPVQIAANRLEDVCRDALKAGVIAPARLSLRAQAKRKFSVITVTLVAGILALLAPLMLVAMGFDITSLGGVDDPKAVDLPQGEEAWVDIRTVYAPERPEAITGIKFATRADCAARGRGRGSCAQTEPRLWSSGRHTTYETMLPDQAYGLLFAITEQAYASGVGTARVLVAATDDTPEGLYRIALNARFLGFSRPCNPLMELLGYCHDNPDVQPSQEARYVTPVLVRVVPGDPARRLGERERLQREAQEKRRRAEARAEEIAKVLGEIRTELKRIDRVLKKNRFEQARDRVEKLAVLFEPLDALAAAQIESAALPDGVSEVREHYDEQRAAIGHFEDDVFDAAFDVLNGPVSARKPEPVLIKQLARRFRVSRDYVREIYAGRPDQIEAQLAARAAAREADEQRRSQARRERCGSLPGDAWKLVEAYMKRRLSRGALSLGECMTPRLSEDHCWVMTCDYREIIAEDSRRRTLRLRASFYIKRGHVVGHGDP